jgi:hypothetical protein
VVLCNEELVSSEMTVLNGSCDRITQTTKGLLLSIYAATHQEQAMGTEKPLTYDYVMIYFIIFLLSRVYAMALWLLRDQAHSLLYRLCLFCLLILLADLQITWTTKWTVLLYVNCMLCYVLGTSLTSSKTSCLFFLGSTEQVMGA